MLSKGIQMFKYMNFIFLDKECDYIKDMVENWKIIQNVEFNKLIVSFLIFENEWLTREQPRV